MPPLPAYAMPSPPGPAEARVGWQVDPARALVLVHDMQKYFIDAFPAGRQPVTTLVANIGRLLAAAAEAGVPVAYTAQPGGMDRVQRGLLHDFWGPGMSADPQHRRIVEALAPQSSDTVLTKWRYSAFHRTGLAELMSAQGRDQLIICGVYAHIGCLVTACDAFSLDIQPFLVADAVADFSAEDHLLALNYAVRRCAAVPDTESVVVALSSVATAT
ncbi:isochorismatase family protein [Streptomyces sp. NPDC047022]|uniref:isochorismatase family protein n=1 Tax=Streptomyces sp. NPDC047022 TaxID=3155737 RepID=UPI0033EAAB42